MGVILIKIKIPLELWEWNRECHRISHQTVFTEQKKLRVKYFIQCRLVIAVIANEVKQSIELKIFSFLAMTISSLLFSISKSFRSIAYVIINPVAVFAKCKQFAFNKSLYV